MPQLTARKNHVYRRPRVTQLIRRDQQIPAAAPAPLPMTTSASASPTIRRGSFMEHARQFPEVYHAPAARMTVPATPSTALHRPPGPPRTPRALLATARCFLTAEHALHPRPGAAWRVA